MEWRILIFSNEFYKKKIVHLECLEVVDEDVWQPELIDQLEVDRNH